MTKKVKSRQAQPGYRDATLPIEARIGDLLSRMTIEEKARQMDQYRGVNLVDKVHPRRRQWMAADARLIKGRLRKIFGKLGAGCIHDLYPIGAGVSNEIQRYAREETRLGIPILMAGEGLHGLIAMGNTIFPQSIALAATWDRAVLRAVGAAIAAETRARGMHEVFGPVLEIARDPRWGRVEEGYGECPYLSARMAVETIKGMQGDDLTRPTAVVAEPKHFAAYSMPQGGLNCAPAFIGERELRNVYLAPFEAAFREAGAMSTMCSYSANDGVPCSASKWLLTKVLREEWGFRGFVRSDLGAIRLLHTAHKTAETPEEAIRQSIEAGMDMQFYDYPNEFFQKTVVDLVNDGKLSMAAVDRAVAGVLRVKFMLGLFENPYTDRSLMKKATHSAKNQAIALRAARESIVLLKNKNNLLPLKKNLKRIAVIGPNANVLQMGDYTQRPVTGFRVETPLAAITRAVSKATKVRHVQGTGILLDEIEPIPSRCLRTPDGRAAGLAGEYFNNMKFEGPPVLCRTDDEIDFNWALALAGGGVASNFFSVRWRGQFVPDRSFDGIIGTQCLDHMRVWIDGELTIDDWDSASAMATKPFRFEKGRRYDLRIEFAKDRSGAAVRFGWSDNREGIAAAVQAAREADVAILCVGGSEETCGEWFDRTDIDLPGRQSELVAAVCATGTPVVMVLFHGRALTITREAEAVDAIVDAWYPGEKGGRAVADVLFGDYNPGGRLPVTIPKSLGQIPIYYNYMGSGKSRYVQCDAEPLFHFGFGLSYTSFRYSNLRIAPKRTGPTGQVTVAVDVRNTGGCAGDEVVQLYLTDCCSSVTTPVKELRGFERLHLRPGQKKTVVFTLSERDFSLLNEHMERVVEPGQFEVLVGPNSQEGLRGNFEITGV